MLLEADELPSEPDVTELPPAAAEMEDTGAELSADLEGEVESNPAINYRKEQSTHQTGSLQGWITKIEEFNTFLNGLDGNSMQAQLNNADCDTLFNDVGRSETKKISRIAQDLSALVESLKGYMLSHDHS